MPTPSALSGPLQDSTGPKPCAPSLGKGRRVVRCRSKKRCMLLGSASRPSCWYPVKARNSRKHCPRCVPHRPKPWTCNLKLRISYYGVLDRMLNTLLVVLARGNLNPRSRNPTLSNRSPLVFHGNTGFKICLIVWIYHRYFR